MKLKLVFATQFAQAQAGTPLGVLAVEIGTQTVDAGFVSQNALFAVEAFVAVLPTQLGFEGPVGLQAIAARSSGIVSLQLALVALEKRFCQGQRIAGEQGKVAAVGFAQIAPKTGFGPQTQDGKPAAQPLQIAELPATLPLVAQGIAQGILTVQQQLFLELTRKTFGTAAR